MMGAANICDFVTGLTPAQVCQLYFVLSAATVLAAAAVPDTVQRLLTAYGARSSDTTPASASSDGRNNATSRELDEDNTGPLIRLISYLASLGQVPHSWFIHFYIFSLSCMVFWAVQFVTHGKLLELIVGNQCSKSTTSMTMSQVVLVWFMMGLQAARRLYECLAVLRPSLATMWIVHWFLGILYYLCMSVSIWVEGSSMSYCHP
ncbi:hypothetical protein F4802DRAFT_167843 [Xylaria palmicola]|nr:hypothetical protein F4802DRAFT_167843 [Xylaria palmicola]